jgi:predicted ribosome quality control (RQC) complex YloA/Tae2 family protein
MDISLDIRKTVGENAASYFEKAKKDKKKIEGTRKIVADYKAKLGSLEAEKSEKKPLLKPAFKKEWYEKFRWFISSDGYLVIGGRDATANELVIKKHTEASDLAFHTEMSGSPFVVVKKEENGREGKIEGEPSEIPESTKEEAATFTAVFSKAWKQGLAAMPVFCVKPEQVSKQAKAGEYIARGAFMIYGEKKFYNVGMSCAIGIYNGKAMSGPLSAVKKHCSQYVELLQGDEKLSDVAKAIKKRLGGELELDDIIRALPANCKIKK